MTSTASDSRGVLTIAAGPVYVEFVTSSAHPPSRVMHAEYFAKGMKPGDKEAARWKPTIGGSVWKALQYKRELVHRRTKKSDGSPDKVVFVSRIAQPRDGSGDDWQQHPFVDDGKWLRKEIESEAKSPAFKDGTAAEYLHLAVSNAGPTAGSDYTFHIQHPTWEPWPVLTICGGAALQLNWKDVLREWESAWKQRRGEFRETIVFLGGVLRTRLLQTLAAAIKSRDPRTVGPDGLLAHAKLVIDFGRTSRRDPVDDDSERTHQQKFHDQIQACARHADVVLADEHTATDFDLRNVENLPKYRLIVRRITRSSEVWWQFRKRKAQGRFRVVSGHFEAPKLKLPERKDGQVTSTPSGRRPARDISLATELCLQAPRNPKRALYQPKKWRRYYDPRTTRRPDELTEIEDLRTEFARLEALLKRNAISTLFLYGETGTGKEVVSRWVHRIHPTYSEGVFHAVSCGRQRGELVQSELFGHVKGAFTNATGDRKGAFWQADGGVLLLDDLDALDVTTQAMLLRVIETGLVRPVGSEFERPVDVFLIVTTNVHPEELMRRTDDSRLREDLYYRMLAGGETVFLPPLRGRPREILRAAKRIWNDQNERFETRFRFPAVLGEAVKKAALPGNYRGLIAPVRKTFRDTLAANDLGQPIPEEGLSLHVQVKDWLRAKRPNSQESQPAGRRTRRLRNAEFFEWLDREDLRKELDAEAVLPDRLQLFCRFWSRWCDVQVERGLKATDCRRLSGPAIRDTLRFDRDSFQRTADALEENRILPRIRIATGKRQPSYYCELIVE